MLIMVFWKNLRLKKIEIKLFAKNTDAMMRLFVRVFKDIRLSI